MNPLLTPHAEAKALPATPANPAPTDTGATPTEAANTTENTAATPPPATDKVDDKFAQRFAFIARKEKAIREREVAIKAQSAELQAKLTELEEFQKDPFAYHEKKDPLALKKWNERKIKGVNGPTAEEQIEEIKQQLRAKEESEAKAKEAREKAEVEAAKLRYDETISQTKNQIDEFISSNPEYELLRAEAVDNPDFSKDLVFHLMEGFYSQHQKILDFKEACQMAEDHLTEIYQKRVTTSSKLKLLVAGSEETSNKVAGVHSAPKLKPDVVPQVTSGTKTLTNHVNQDIPNRADRKLTLEESKERLAKEFIRFT